jgi:hypothetical protein
MFSTVWILTMTVHSKWYSLHGTEYQLSTGVSGCLDHWLKPAA